MMPIEKINENIVCEKHNKPSHIYCSTCMDAYCEICDELIHSTNSTLEKHERIDTNQINNNILNQLQKDLIVNETKSTLIDNRNVISNSSSSLNKLSLSSSTTSPPNNSANSTPNLNSELEIDHSDIDPFSITSSSPINKNSPLLSRKNKKNNNSDSDDDNTNNNNNNNNDIKVNMVTFTNEFEFKSNSCALEEGEVDDYNQEEEKKNREAAHVGQGIVQGAICFGTEIADGAKGLVMGPVDGAKKGAKEFFKGVSTGLLGVVVHPLRATGGLLVKTSEGLRNTPDTIFSDKSDPLNLDTFHQKEKEADNVLEGIFQGTLSLSKGIFDGVTGIVTEPIKGVQEGGGAKGFFKGVGSGLMGAVLKPTSGVIDFLGKPIEGIGSQFKSNIQSIKNL